MNAHHEGAQMAVTGWLALGGTAGFIAGARLWWRKMSGRR